MKLVELAFKTRSFSRSFCRDRVSLSARRSPQVWGRSPSPHLFTRDHGERILNILISTQVKTLFWTDAGNILGVLGAGAAANADHAAKVVVFPGDDFPNTWDGELAFELKANKVFDSYYGGAELGQEGGDEGGPD